MSAPVTPAYMPRNAGAPVAPSPKIAFRNESFLNSHAGRTTRVVAEFTEFPARMQRSGVRGTFLFFGSARAKSAEQLAEKKALNEAVIANADASAKEKSDAAKNLSILVKQAWMCEFYDVTEQLAALLTTWSMSAEGIRVGQHMSTHFGDGTPSTVQPLMVCTGGGPGFMEAGNKGAFKAGGASMGVAVTLPFEDKMNPYVTEGMDFVMDYFFTRKFWEVCAAKAMICCPGGFGTCDEMFEVLCLMQCNHCPKMPVVLIGSKFWKDVLNFEKFDEYGVVSVKDVDDLFFADDAQSAFNYIREALLAEVREGSTTPPTERK